VLVSNSVINDPQALSIKAIYNGTVVQDGHTKDMIFIVPPLIAYFSQGTTLEAGTIIITGTPAGMESSKTHELFSNITLTFALR
jgi:2-keto-4-pentenoate hydratase/2-oxohepta-3-ene-1,7-dioic acid hydratase in catechol pathway